MEDENNHIKNDSILIKEVERKTEENNILSEWANKAMC